MDLEELIRKLMSHADQGEVVAALQAHAQPIYQRVWNAGHKKATDEGKTKRAELENRITELQGEIDAKVATITDLEKRQPDLAKIRADHQADLQKLRDKMAATEASLKGQIQAERERSVMERLGGKLKSGLDPDYAEVQASKLKGRIRFRDDGGVEVLQADGTTPYAPQDGKDPLDMLVADTVKAAPAKFQTGTADTSGMGGPTREDATRGGGGQQRTGQAAFFDGIRKEAEEAQQAATPAGGSAAARLAGLSGGTTGTKPAAGR